MWAECAVDAGTLDAHQGAQVDGGPVRIGRAAVRAAIIAGNPAQRLDVCARSTLAECMRASSYNTIPRTLMNIC